MEGGMSVFYSSFPLFIELICLWVIVSKNYEILTKKYYDVDFSSEMVLVATMVVYGLFVYFFNWGVM